MLFVSGCSQRTVPTIRYHLTFFIDGMKQEVVIDDLLPCNKHQSLVFSRMHRGQLWAPLIEKALAKQLGGYAALAGGRSIEGLRCLTGMACEEIWLHPESVSAGGAGRGKAAPAMDLDMLWARLDSFVAAGFLMGASCAPDFVDAATTQRYANDLGLQTNHCYSLLATKMLVHKGHTVRLVQLRNPWGAKCWKGRWGNSDKTRWTHEMLRQVCLGRSGSWYIDPFHRRELPPLTMCALPCFFDCAIHVG